MRAFVGIIAVAVGCGSGEGKTTTSGGTGGSLTLNSAEDVATLCAEGDPITVSLLVEFPATDPSCPFGEGDNLPEQDAVITARVEQQVELGLPEGAVVCGMAFDFQGISGGEGTPMVYDDNFFFTFNDVVLAASYGPMVDVFSTEGALPLYDWADIVGYGFQFDNSIPTWCLGEADGRSSCEIPPPETNGIMSLQFDSTLVDELSFRAVELNRFDFTFITMGDNDAGTDCAHEDFAFKVDVPYIRLD